MATKKQSASEKEAFSNNSTEIATKYIDPKKE